MNELTWTSKKPMVEGWYWWRSHALDNEVIVRVPDSRYPLLKIGGQWAGPIPIPKKKKEAI